MSYPKHTYYGTVKEGKLKIRNRQAMEHNLLQYEGRQMEITIKQYQSTRSEQQNRWYWACIELISDYTGFSKNETHDIVKYKFLKKEKVIEATGEVVEYLGSTASLKKGEFAEFMDKFMQWSAEIGCPLPPPGTQFELIK